MNAVKVIKKEIGEFKPEIAFIFGSGLKTACPDMKVVAEISYDKIGFPKSIVKGHDGKLVFGEYKDMKIVTATRFHYYESGDIKKVALPFELLAELGVKDIVLATATGGVSDRVKTGDIVLIKDHINLAPNPLVGRKDQYFLDMSNAYEPVYRNIIKEISMEEKIDIIEGVHLQLTGPTYETMAEVNMAKILGADTVSMSTAQDVILSRFYGINVLCFAVVCNKSGLSATHDEILDSSNKASSKLKVLISKFVENQSINKKQ